MLQQVMKVIFLIFLFALSKIDAKLDARTTDIGNKIDTNGIALDKPANEFDARPSAPVTGASNTKIPLRSVRLRPPKTFIGEKDGDEQSDVLLSRILSTVPKRLQQLQQHIVDTEPTMLTHLKRESQKANETVEADDVPLPSFINTTAGVGRCEFWNIWGKPCPVRVGTIGVGTPMQKFDVVLSFASHQFWVYGSKTVCSQSAEEGVNKHVFDSNASTTANFTENKINFNDAAVSDGRIVLTKASGNVVQDTVQVGNTALTNVSFGSINDVYCRFCSTEFKVPADGHMSLMLVREIGSSWNKIRSPLFELAAQASKPLITIHQKPAKFKWKEDYLDGSLTIGNENAEQCSSFTPPIPYITSRIHKYSDYLEGQPRIRVKSLKLSDGFDVAIEPREAAFVEGLGIQLYKEEAVRIGQHFDAFGARRIQPGLYHIPCHNRGKLPSLQLEIADPKNGSMVLDFNEYIVNIRKNTCILGVYINIYSLHNKGLPIVIGNGMLQGKCMALNVLEQTVAFGTAI